jgi:hypothetical protein
LPAVGDGRGGAATGSGEAMNRDQFDDWTIGWTVAASRRTAVRALGGGGLALVIGLLGVRGTAAVCRIEGAKCTRRGQCCGACRKGKCRSTRRGTCRAGDDTCQAPGGVGCNGSSPCGCFVTTHGKSFCGDGGSCMACTSNQQCVGGFGAGAACVFFTGANCSCGPGTACVTPCPRA